MMSARVKYSREEIIPDRKITPFLWFNGNAEEAVSFYVSVFNHSGTGKKLHYDEQSAKVSGMPEDSILTIEFELEGLPFTALNGEPSFPFNPSVSFYVTCNSPGEVERLWERLSDGGKVIMELKNYPFSERYGWVQDRYGLSWQLIAGPSGQEISPCLMFAGDQQGRAEEAIGFYRSVFSDFKLIMNEYYREGETKADAKIVHAEFDMGGQKFIILDSGVELPGVNFNESVSFVVQCKSQQEIDDYWARLSDGGDPAAQQCGWLKDRFGLSWQIVPEELPDLLGDPNGERSSQVMEALLEMKKIDVTVLRTMAGKQR